MKTEADEQKELAVWLNNAGVLWCHVPNGGKRSQREGASLRAQGVRRGVPDILIFTPPPFRGEYIGTAIELKRAKPASSRISEEQRKWLIALQINDWHATVCYGADNAIKELKRLGYRSIIDGD